MSFLFRTLLFLTALNLLSGNVPGVMIKLSRLSGFFLIIFWIASFFPAPFRRTSKELSLLFLMFISFFLFFFEWGYLPGLAIIVLSLRTLLMEKDRETAITLSASLIAVFVYSIFQVFYQFNPYLWYLLQNLSLWYSPLVTGLLGNKMTLGASASGLSITISIFCFCLGLMHHNREKLFLFFAGLIPLAANFLFLGIQKHVSRWIHLTNKELSPDIFEMQMLLLVIASVLLYALWRIVGIGQEEEEGEEGIDLKMVLMCSVIVLLSASIISFYKTGPAKTGKILFVDKGTNWKVPVYGKKYGQKSSGMFGILPHYLRMRGYEATVYKKDLTPEILSGVAALVIFNPARHFSETEQKLITGFVEKGGGLFVAGDHSDVNGIMKPINEIIAPFNISLKFDTALSLKTGWINSLEKRNNPLTIDIVEDYETGIWVGASLGVSPPAQPVIVGKYGWADYGDYENKRAFLGDYKRSPEEQLGDVVLVASSEFGKGRVIVFGDTSTFQNGIICGTYFFIDRIFQYLLSGSSSLNNPLIQFIISVILLGIAGFVINRRYSDVLICACVISVSIGTLTSSSLFSKPEPIPNSIKKSFYIPVYIDASHIGRHAKLSSSEHSLYGVVLNLLRNRLMPIYLDEFSKEKLSYSKLLFVVAPTKEFTPEEVAILKEFMEKGGKIVWAVGWEDMAASKSFLDEFQFTIDNVPLGPQEVEVGNYKPVFGEAWPISTENTKSKSIAQKWGYPVIVYQKVGKGGVLLVADSKFFLARNIESYKGYKLVNIQFFKYLLDTTILGRKQLVD